ncbi:uncharacterized protein MONBRDRAFT_9083 [Monosiga brevicollis MX1]|uniref:Uncharacterized protein n=1 Tax=Monosiga brevicollis TaxID=81824 RepID=A9V215_MONBE|nr:uncharacterized protein MONBRDRAFT_9083 [Monosiga brevicollis MX1]EDQ88664.1 predicted protein [Monosiga brevicollis MX1]|eukprot:XP_001746768.1 hypothetical protein [Monosiga brevicollis MX1]
MAPSLKQATSKTPTLLTKWLRAAQTRRAPDAPGNRTTPPPSESQQDSTAATRAAADAVSVTPARRTVKLDSLGSSRQVENPKPSTEEDHGSWPAASESTKIVARDTDAIKVQETGAPSIFTAPTTADDHCGDDHQESPDAVVALRHDGQIEMKSVAAEMEGEAMEDADQDDDDEDDDDYEARRLANIQANQALMQQLGLLSAATALPMAHPTPSPGTVNGPKKLPNRSRSKRRTSGSTPSPQPVRRSRRLAAKEARPMTEEDEATQAALLAYAGLGATEESPRAPSNEGANLAAIAPIGTVITGDALVADAGLVLKARAALEPDEQHLLWTGHRHDVYAIDSLEERGCVAMAGKEGRMSLWHRPDASGAAPAPYTAAPRLSSKLHGRWISGVRLLSTSDQVLAATSSDDGSLLLSELVLDPEAPWTCRPVQRSTEGHTAGIFGLDAWAGTSLCTASKDGCVGEWDIGPASCRLVAQREVSNAVLKSVSMRDGNIYATAGNDSSVYMLDRRATDPTGTFEGAHAGVVASVAFNRHQPNWLASQGQPDYGLVAVHRLCTGWQFPVACHVWVCRSCRGFVLTGATLLAGFDGLLKVWDMRQLQEPVFATTSHNGNGHGKPQMAAPHWITPTELTVAGTKSLQLTTFEIPTGVLTRRVHLGFTPTAFTPCASGVLAAASRNAAWLFQHGTEDS